MADSIPVSFFNSNILPVTVQVNNGAQFKIAAATAADGFAPKLPASGGPTWSYTGRSNNVLGPGKNSIVITPDQGVDPFSFTVELSGDVQFQSIQLYVFWNTSQSVNWILLNNGRYVDGSVSLSSKAS